ncbi:MAG: NAD(P)H-dependent flavin oxidoreductase [Pigmentiphaga sp.]
MPPRLPAALDRLDLPIIGAPMFIVSGPALVLAQCRAGILGSMPALNGRSSAQLDEWLAEMTAALAADAEAGVRSAPFAVNLIVHRSNQRLEADLRLVEKYRVPVVITSLGARPEVNQAVQAYGGIVLHDVINDTFARKAVAKGANGLVAVAAGAGGHAGRLSPFALVQEIREWFDGPLALSGAIATGRAVRAARVLGADFAYVGSAFIATEEANAVEAYKAAVVAARAEDIVYTDAFTGVHGNYLRSSIVGAGLDPDRLNEREPAMMDFDNEAARRKAWKDIWGSGQGIGLVEKVLPVHEVVARLRREYLATL